MFFYGENLSNPVAAFGTLGGVTYTANTVGSAGNNITVTHTAGAAGSAGSAGSQGYSVYANSYITWINTGTRNGPIF